MKAEVWKSSESTMGQHMAHMPPSLHLMLITDVGLTSTRADSDSASSHSHIRRAPVIVICPNEVEWRHRSLIYLVSGNHSRSGRIGTCLFSTLFFVQSPTLRTTSRAFLPCVFWLGLLGGIHRSESWRRVILGYLFLAGVATGWLRPFTERHDSCQHPLQFQKRFSPDVGVVMGLQYCQPWSRILSLFSSPKSFPYLCR